MINTSRAVVLVIAAIAASSSGADAFKPSAQTIISSKNFATSPLLENATDDLAAAAANAGVKYFSKQVEVIRGGDGEDTSGLKSADVVKAHGLTCLLFAAIFFLDTVGVKIPLLGPDVLVPGYNSGDKTVKLLTRFMCGLWTGMGMMELEFYENSTMVAIFKKFHIALAPVLLWTTNEIGGEGMHWFSPIAVALFGIGSIIGK